ncbi:ABC transporter ATP-binding protein, partial [Streptomyces sp. SID10244]|nr:ABC transporter ATP-binding protein [Streptomyces sp. SID10244]
HLEDAALVDPAARSNGSTLTASVDVIESMGSDNYVYFTVDSPAASSDALDELAADSGAEIGGGQMIARVSPESRIARGGTAELFYEASKV